MTRNEMHTMFRTLGQQMGLQQVRGILPESIDVYLNVAQTEIVREVIKSHLALQRKEKVSQSDNSFSPISSLRNLYEKATMDNDYVNGYTPIKINDYYECIIPVPANVKVMIYTSVKVVYNNTIKHCRIVDYDDVSKVLNDYCSKPSKEYPIASFINNTFVVYTDLDWLSVDISYIKEPNHIGENKDSNVDEYLHTEIVERAVNKFLTSVRNTSQQ